MTPAAARASDPKRLAEQGREDEPLLLAAAEAVADGAFTEADAALNIRCSSDCSAGLASAAIRLCTGLTLPRTEPLRPLSGCRTP